LRSAGTRQVSRVIIGDRQTASIGTHIAAKLRKITHSIGRRPQIIDGSGRCGDPQRVGQPTGNAGSRRWMTGVPASRWRGPRASYPPCQHRPPTRSRSMSTRTSLTATASRPVFVSSSRSHTCCLRAAQVSASGSHGGRPAESSAPPRDSWRSSPGSRSSSPQSTRAGCGTSAPSTCAGGHDLCPT